MCMKLHVYTIVGDSTQAWLRGATPGPRSGAEAGKTPCPRAGGQEELPHARGQRQQLERCLRSRRRA